MGDTATAIKLYGQRATMADWAEEAFCAQYQVGVLQMDRDWKAAVEALLAAWAMRPTRAEPLYQLAFGWRSREAWPVAYLFAARGATIPVPQDILFVDMPLYKWGLLFERSVAAWYVGEKDQALADTQALLADPELPEPWRAHAQGNVIFLEEALGVRTTDE